MFDRILIANRGEIACRIIRTCRRLGVQTVAVYSDADRAALHVRMADTAVRIGPADVADSYLRGDRIIAAAQQTGAQGVHPGYGFLSENPDFVADVAQAGLTFIGPSETAIRAMGLKDRAKDLMAAAGVPVVPGYRGDDQSDDRLAAAATETGYPVLIKAVAGGGGKGMRLVARAADFADALRAARSEARTAFGNDRVLIEKFIASPRHVEVQVFGDGHDAVHLFERDCSLQRRHQKVIEEVPAPGMTAAVRDAMGAAAVRAAQSIGYAGAGTVEFIADGRDGLRADGFWFMEMNTRLQVEHPVTEAVTGIDLVEWQLRVAAGAPLPCTQADIALTGHAIEARLYAEDVPAGFLPATGRIAHLALPPDIRVDSGVQAGDAISPWYDPMIAKLVAAGPDRATALRRLRRALAATEVAGLVTNLDFLQRLVADPDFAAGQVDTGLIARSGDALTAPLPVAPWQAAWAAIVASGCDGPAQPHQGFTLWQPLTQDVALRQDDAEITVALQFHGPDRIVAHVAGETCAFTRNAGRWLCDTGPCPAALRHDGRVTLFGPGPLVFDLPDPLARDVAGDSGDVVLAPMPGLVRAVSVVAGDDVNDGQPLLVLEAMKMEHVLRAPRAGRIRSLNVAAGAQVDAGDTLVTLEDTEEEAAP